MRVGAAHERCVQHVRELDIANKARLAAHEVHVLDPGSRLSYYCGHARLLNQVDLVKAGDRLCFPCLGPGDTELLELISAQARPRDDSPGDNCRPCHNGKASMFPASRVRDENNPAVDAPIYNVLQCLGEIFEPSDDNRGGLEFARLEQSEDFTHTLIHEIGRTLAIVTHLKTADFDVLDQQIICLDARDASGSKSDHD